MNKRGQVFLISALIIIGVVIGLVRISNQSTSREKPEAFLDLSEEISFETKRVLDYEEIQLKNTGSSDPGISISNLLNEYIENVGLNDVAFIYGNLDLDPDPLNKIVKAYYYESTSVNAVGIYGMSHSLIIANSRQIDVRHDIDTEMVSIKIDDIDYSFKLKRGQNFYFVISRNEDGEKFVTVK